MCHKCARELKHYPHPEINSLFPLQCCKHLLNIIMSIVLKCDFKYSWCQNRRRWLTIYFFSESAIQCIICFQFVAVLYCITLGFRTDPSKSPVNGNLMTLDVSCWNRKLGNEKSKMYKFSHQDDVTSDISGIGSRVLYMGQLCGLWMSQNCRFSLFLIGQDEEELVDFLLLDWPCTILLY